MTVQATSDVIISPIAHVNGQSSIRAFVKQIFSELPDEVTPYHVRLYYEIYQKWRQLLGEDILPPLSEYGSDPCIWPLSHSEGFVVKWDLKYQNGDILLNILMSYSFELDSANFLDPKSSSSTRRRSCNCPGGNYTWRCDSYFAS